MDENWERNAKLAQAGYADALEQVLDGDDIVDYTIRQEAEVPTTRTQNVARNNSGENHHVSYLDIDDDMEAHALRKEAISLILDDGDEFNEKLADIMPLPNVTNEGELREPNTAAAAPPRKAKKPASLAPGAYSVIGSLAVARYESGALTPTDGLMSERIKKDEMDDSQRLKKVVEQDCNGPEVAGEPDIGFQYEPKKTDGKNNPIVK